MTGSRRRVSGESGMATLEVVVLFPVLLIVMLVCAQLALYWHYRQLAVAAAQDAATDFAERGGAGSPGEVVALLDDYGAGRIELSGPPEVSVLADPQTGAPDTVVVRIEGDVSAIPDGLSIHVAAEASAGVEVFRD